MRIQKIREQCAPQLTVLSLVKREKSNICNVYIITKQRNRNIYFYIIIHDFMMVKTRQIIETCTLYSPLYFVIKLLILYYIQEPSPDVALTTTPLSAGSSSFVLIGANAAWAKHYGKPECCISGSATSALTQ